MEKQYRFSKENYFGTLIKRSDFILKLKDYIPTFLLNLLRRCNGRMIKAKTVTKYKLDALIHSDKAIYKCPCCNMKLCEFVSGGFEQQPTFFNPKGNENTKQEVLCPVCSSLPRHRILASWCEVHKDELQGKLLYFAPEEGMKKWFNINKINYTTADLFAPADLKLDIENTSQLNESWDIIICNHVLEHVNDYQKALIEIYRILKSGGIFICSFPILENLKTLIEEKEHTEENKAKRLELYGQADHLRIFGSDSDELLRQAGFIVSRIDGNDMPDSILPIIGPADYDVNYLFCCQKP